MECDRMRGILIKSISDILNLNPPSEEMSLKRRKIESPKKECIGMSAAEVSCKDTAYSSKHSGPGAVTKGMAPTISGWSGISISYVLIWKVTWTVVIVGFVTRTLVLVLVLVVLVQACSCENMFLLANCRDLNHLTLI